MWAGRTKLLRGGSPADYPLAMEESGQDLFCSRIFFNAENVSPVACS